MVLVCAFLISGCSGFYQPGSEITHVCSRIYLTDYNTVWQSILEALKDYDRTVVNRQGGVIVTNWVENTAQKNFIEAFGGASTYIKAKYRLNITVAPGNYNGKPSVKVGIQKDQMIQTDILEGWKQVASDSIDENTILYRVGRVIYIKLKLKRLEERKTEKVMEEGV